MPIQQLPCAKCGHINEPQRVYCHNCGEKLDRTAIIQAAEKEAKKAAAKPKGLPKPKVPVFRVYVLPVLGAILLGAMTASIICMLTPPEKLPDDVPEALRLDPPNLKIALERALSLPGAGKFGVTAEHINAYFASRIGARSTPGIGFMIAWDRAAAELAPGTAAVYIIRRLVAGSEAPKRSEMHQHHPLVVRADFEITKTDGEPGIAARAKSGSIGRLRLPGAVMELLKGMFYGELAGVMKDEIIDLGKMKSVKVSKGVLEIEPPGAGN